MNNSQLIKCKKEDYNNQLRVQFSNKNSKPILFCSESCLFSVLNKYQNLDKEFDYENPNEVKKLVQNLVSQIKQLQSELKNLKKIRKTYFGIFKELNLKDETYKRKWSFAKEVDE